MLSLLSAALAVSSGAVLAEGPSRPNIVFAFGDDYGRYASIYAEVDKEDMISPLIETPNFDRVAREGVLMTNCFAPAPSSTACRSSLFSGQYFWRTGHGAFLHCSPWDDSIPTYPLLLEGSGYHIGYTYKAWGPGEPANQPYGGRRNACQSGSDRWGLFSINATKRIASDTTSRDKAASVRMAKDELYAEVEANFRAFLDRRDPEKPFCYLWGPTNTHRPWQRGSGAELWGLNPDDLKGRLPSFLPDVPEIREDVADYLGECLAFDAGLGVLIRMLEEIGELDNTIIVVSGDHGIPGFPRGKCNLYDLGTRVGMAVRYPKTIAPGRVVTDFMLLMDLAPTFLEFAGLEVPDVMNGNSMKKVWESGKSGRVDRSNDHVVVGKERHVVTAREGRLAYPQRAIVTDSYKYIRNLEPERSPVGPYERYFPDLDDGPTKRWMYAHYDDEEYSWEMDLAFGQRPYEELYDTRKDPYETNNLAADPRYRKILMKLSGRLDVVMRESNDPRLQLDCVFDSPEYTDMSHTSQRQAEIDRKIERARMEALKLKNR